MKHMFFLTAGLLLFLALAAQKMAAGFDYTFNPTEQVPRYFVTTDKEDTLWHRKAWYLPEKSLAMEGWYLDAACTLPQGTVTWYHTTRYPKSKGTFVNGKKEGSYQEYNEEGMCVDSGFYVNNRLSGIRLRYRNDGLLADSMHFDGAGNGVEVLWNEEGGPWAAGRWVSDTLKNGRWQYFHLNGRLEAIEDFEGGKRIAIQCYDSSGTLLPVETYAEVEANSSGGESAWQTYLLANLRAITPVRMGAPLGEYKVAVRFVVDRDGNITDSKALTRFGYGMEEEVIRLLNKSPKWQPARLHGQPVKAYRIQPVTFVVSKG